MKIRFIGDTPIRIDDKPMQPGEAVDVDDELGEALIKGERFELVEEKPKRKKKKDEAQDEES